MQNNPKYMFLILMYDDRCLISGNKAQVAKAKTIIEEFIASSLGSYILFYLFILNF